jgi:hypothetical protein
MRIPWASLSPFIKAGAVFRDEKYLFTDGGSKPKWFVVLSDKIIENSYIYCLTTSQVDTYLGSYSTFIKCQDPVFGKDIIIEIERIYVMDINKIKAKYENGIIEYKGTLKQTLLEEIKEEIENSERIEEIFKDWILY